MGEELLLTPAGPVSAPAVALLTGLIVRPRCLAVAGAKNLRVAPRWLSRSDWDSLSAQHRMTECSLSAS